MKLVGVQSGSICRWECGYNLDPLCGLMFCSNTDRSLATSKWITNILLYIQKKNGSSISVWLEKRCGTKLKLFSPLCCHPSKS